MSNTAETGALIAAENVQGATIYSSTTRDKLGSVDDIMIDRKTGNVAYAIMASGGFMGIASRHHSLPWSMLKYDADLGGYVVHLERAQLEGVPAYGRWL